MLLYLLLLPAAIALAPDGPWDSFNYAPKSKTVYPQAVYKSVGTVSGSGKLVGNMGSATLSPSSWIALDFGIEVGGLVSLNFDAVGNTSSVSLSFTESPMFVNPLASDDSSYPAPNMTYDGVFTIPAPLSKGYWTQPSYSLRGGFRYLTIVSHSETALEISNVSCAISFMPHVENLRAYTGYFYASDPVFHDPDFLTKVWYAGAYTVQTNTVPLHTGRQVPFAAAGSWFNNATLGVAGPIIVDGAKRDRAVWPGDMGIAVPTQFVSTFDLIPTRNALSTMFAAINPETGALPESGPPLSQLGSDTYHCWTLIGTHNYYLYSGDDDWLSTIWTNYTRAIAFVEGKVDSTGLMDVTGLRDWGRLGGGGYNAEGNAILYKASSIVLLTASDLANYMGDESLSAAWGANATALKAKFNEAFWVESAGMYRDNLTTTLHPQDANSFAVLYNLTLSDEQKVAVSQGLEKNWNDLGPVVPELPDTISPFISGFELQAHFEAGQDDRALDLLRREWGYILYTNLSVQSTLLEGFTANGSLWYRSYRGYNYDAAYTSHAHGWSSGPTSALTFYILGLTITSPRGATWSLSPHINGGLPGAEGGFGTSLGWFGVKWALQDNQFFMEISTPEGTSGQVKLPRNGSVVVDEEAVDVDADGEIALTGGKHSVAIFS
ncbi:Six-hairpin glycosidase [Guyanagaster necrorhizus]|uniref:Six-hairpin glycosidase n=1 Tax=Guyanagaster necrorhizus TaxID=856835 RepID=A0A9P7VM56_9AGAR|nr:Six-hairpin glycosidase [Guyanagaster necrorhizus MCA 3950]KAG7443761.1 Six-hairpin glycosidase [Guyanagaster necrorhizus MCA 3950]